MTESAISLLEARVASDDDLIGDQPLESIISESGQAPKSNHLVGALIHYSKSIGNSLIDFMDYICDPLVSIQCVGKDGKPFKLYKIRTMVKGAESYHHATIEEKGLDELGKPKDDPRVTWYGRLMRPYGIDEIPQVYNFFFGQISLVGIRPKPDSMWEKYPADIRERSRKKRPGFAGIQYAANTGSFEDIFEVYREWLDDHDKSPFYATLKWGYRIAYNIIVKGKRSR